MLKQSKLYKFIHTELNLNIQFFEGQKLVSDLAIIQNLDNIGFKYFRDCVLTVQHLMSFLKHRESLGFYIDSEDPFFRLKLETNALGYVRTLLLPESFNTLPEKINGICRLTKIMPDAKHPYNSLIKIDDLPFKKIVKELLAQSFQITGESILSANVDQSLFITQLPKKSLKSEAESVDAPIDKIANIKKFLNKYHKQIDALLSNESLESDDIIKGFADLGCISLSSTEVEFKCSCSRERMLAGVESMLLTTTIDDIFLQKDHIETTCDYCKTSFLITKEELL